MSKQPANVQEATRQIIEAGIAHRMLVGSKQHHLPDDPSGCKFWVEVESNGMQQIIVETPDGHQQAFSADTGTFGVYRQPPLSESQQAVVDQLAREWLQKRSQSTSQ